VGVCIVFKLRLQTEYLRTLTADCWTAGLLDVLRLRLEDADYWILDCGLLDCGLKLTLALSIENNGQNRQHRTWRVSTPCSMEDVSDPPPCLCKEQGCDMMYTEFILEGSACCGV
jgi:hypothetical protein